MISYIINLDRSTERISFVAKQFDELGVEYERVSAVDAVSLGAVVEGYQRNFNDWPRLYPPEVACFLSHVICWRRIASGSDAYGAVFEDDIILSPKILPFLKSHNLPSKIDVLKIETFLCELSLKRFDSVRVQGEKAYRLNSFHPGTAGYIISKSSASKLLKIIEAGINCPVDHFLFDNNVNFKNSINVFQLSIGLCVQDDRFNFECSHFKSEIKQRSSDDWKSHSIVKPQPIKERRFFKKIPREVRRLYSKLKNKIKYFTVEYIDFPKD